MTTQTTPRPDIRMSSRTESASKWVQLISLAASCYNVGTILMTQLGYRLWARVGRAGPTPLALTSRSLLAGLVKHHRVDAGVGHDCCVVGTLAGSIEAGTTGGWITRSSLPPFADHALATGRAFHSRRRFAVLDGGEEFSGA